VSASLIGSNTFTFADGNAGHSCNLGSAPNVGELDVLCVNSNTVVTTPSGFTVAPSSVGGQGAYIYRRIAVGGEASTVTITTSGDHNTQVSWSRWGSITGADDAKATAADGISGSSTPAHSTNPLAASGELVIAFGALHSIGSPTPTSPVWSSGYTALTSATQGTGVTGVTGFVGYRVDGSGTESPQVSWTNATSDRYMLTLTFTASSTSNISGTDSGTLTDSAALVVAVAPADSAALTDSAVVTVAIPASDSAVLEDSAFGTGDASAVGARPPIVSSTPGGRIVSQTRGGVL
jgi:hypothetical protein